MSIRGWVYDKFIAADMTSRWYKDVLSSVPSGSRILDIGVGTAASLCMNKELITRNDLHITGVDYDRAYITTATINCQLENISDNVNILELDINTESIQDHLGKTEYDVVLLCGVLMITPDPSSVLKKASEILKPGGCIYIVQTFGKATIPMLSWAKSMLWYVTSIDFGRDMTMDSMTMAITQSGLKLVETRAVKHTTPGYFRDEIVLILTKQ